MTGLKHVPVLIVIAAIAGVLAPTVHGAIFTVTSAADRVDANPGDGNCDDGTGHCTLRAAIMEANASAAANTINLPAGTYTFPQAPTPCPFPELNRQPPQAI